jgi:hypothetical protein
MPRSRCRTPESRHQAARRARAARAPRVISPIEQVGEIEQMEDGGTAVCDMGGAGR